MAYIQKISFSHVGRKEGCTCDRCGQYIQNIVTVDYTDGVTMNYGQDCFEKLYKSGKLTAYGEKLMKKLLKRIQKHSEDHEMWKTITYEEAKEKGLTDRIDPDSNRNTWSTEERDKDPWCGHPFEEYREFMLGCLEEWMKDDQKELKRFAKANFDR